MSVRGSCRLLVLEVQRGVAIPICGRHTRCESAGNELRGRAQHSIRCAKDGSAAHAGDDVEVRGLWHPGHLCSTARTDHTSLEQDVLEFVESPARKVVVCVDHAVVTRPDINRCLSDLL